MFDLILLLAGKGTRSGLDYNKIKYIVDGKPLYQYSINEFRKSKYLNKIILVVNKDDLDYFNNIEDFKNDRFIICVGGKERQDSVLSGLVHSSADIVLIHDGARANVRIEDIDQVYEKTEEYDVACLAVKEKNAIKRVDGNFINENIDRENVYLMQTPQGAKRELLKKALENVDHIVYDDIQAIKDVCGIDAYLVLGHEDNIKVTSNDDLDLISYLIKKRKGDKNV